MLDKALYIMLFMWTINFVLLGVQFALLDVIHVELLINCSDNSDYCNSAKGTPLKTPIVGWVTDSNINEIVSRASGGDYTGTGIIDKFVSFAIIAAYVGWDIILLLTGINIFLFMYFMGVPMIFVIGIGLVYSILLIRAIVGYIRGV